MSVHYILRTILRYNNKQNQPNLCLHGAYISVPYPNNKQIYYIVLEIRTMMKNKAGKEVVGLLFEVWKSVKVWLKGKCEQRPE